MGITMYDTEEMRKWSGDIDTAAEDFMDEVNKLYQNIELFVSDDFTGNVSEDFTNEVLDQKSFYTNLKSLLEDSADLIKKNANTYGANAEMLSSEIKSKNPLRDMNGGEF